MSSTMLPIALLALLPLAAASVKFDGNVPTSVTFGTKFTIKWTSDSKPVKVTLNGGDKYALFDVVCGKWINNVMSNACTSDTTSVSWTPDDSIPEGIYNIVATDAKGNTDSSNSISIARGNGPSTLSSPSSTTTTATASSATAATTGSNTSASPTQSSTSAASSSSSSGASNASQSTGLGTGAKAGVGIGAAVGGIALLGGLGFLLFRMGKKAAANKDKKKDDGSNGENGDVTAEGNAGAAGVAGAAAAAAAANRDSKDDDEKAGGPAEMAAPEFIHEAPDYKLRLDSPGGKELFSELDATGGSFMLASSRPSTAAGGIDPDSAFSKRIGSPDEERPVTPSITVTAPEAENSGAAAKTSTSPGGKSVDSTGAVSNAPSEATTAVGSPDRNEGTNSSVEKAEASEPTETHPAAAETAPVAPTLEGTTEKEETKQ